MVELENDQISDQTGLEGLENIKNRKFRNFLKIPEFFFKTHEVHVRGPVWSIEGPRLVLTLWRYGLVCLESLEMGFVA